MPVKSGIISRGGGVLPRISEPVAGIDLGKGGNRYKFLTSLFPGEQYEEKKGAEHMCSIHVYNTLTVSVTVRIVVLEEV